MNRCCEDKGKLCCFAEPTERECLEARIAELTEALELLWDYCGCSLEDEKKTFSVVEFVNKWGEPSEKEISQRMHDALAYEMI